MPAGIWADKRLAQAENAIRLASHGYAVAVISYRVSSERRFPAWIHDCTAAGALAAIEGGRIWLDPQRSGGTGRK